MAPSASGRRESGRERERERDRSPAASEHHHRDHGRSSSHKTSERSRSPSRSSMDRSSERQYRRSSSRDRRSERRLSERSRSPVIRDRKEVHRSRSPRSPRSDRRSPSRRSPRRSASYEGRRDSYRSRSRSRSRERRDYSKRKEVDDDKERKRKGDERKEREESHGRGERKDSDRERDRDKEVENISAGFIEKPADGYMEEDGEIREFQTEDEVQIKANSDALAAGLLDAKKSEPLSLEEILKKRKEDALQQAKDVQGISNCRLIILSWKGNCKVSVKYLIVRHGKNTFPKGKGYRMIVCQKLVQYVDVGSPELKFETQGTRMIS